MSDDDLDRVAPLDVADLLDGPEAIAAYLEAAAELDDPATFVAAVGHAARAFGMSQLAARAGVGRESLYKSLAPSTQPRFETIARVLSAMGVRLTVTTGPRR